MVFEQYSVTCIRSCQQSGVLLYVLLECLDVQQATITMKFCNIIYIKVSMCFEQPHAHFACRLHNPAKFTLKY